MSYVLSLFVQLFDARMGVLQFSGQVRLICYKDGDLVVLPVDRILECVVVAPQLPVG